jgi:enoyl-[acyl-carrier-protein] reductase (NADH)
MAMTYYNDKARSFVAPRAEEAQAQPLPCNMLQDGQLEAVMGPLKAALEASVRYLAREFGPASIRVNPISAEPVRTRAASRITHYASAITGEVVHVDAGFHVEGMLFH